MANMLVSVLNFSDASKIYKKIYNYYINNNLSKDLILKYMFNFILCKIAMNDIEKIEKIKNKYKMLLGDKMSTNVLLIENIIYSILSKNRRKMELIINKYMEHNVVDNINIKILYHIKNNIN